MASKLVSSASMSCKVILANTIAKSLLAEVQTGLISLNRKPPHLLGILANADPAAKVYADWTQRTCKENGFDYTLRQCEKDSVEEVIIAANNNDEYDGIIVYYPIHGNRHDQYLQNIVALEKDVEGLSHRYIFNMYQNIRFLDDDEVMKSILPCTPLAVIKILEFLHIYNIILPYGNRLFGRTIAVVNRSEVVGRPLAALLANDGACVYSVDVTGVQQFTRGEGIRKRKHDVLEKEGWTIEQVVPICDVVITGVPGDKFRFPVHLLKEGAVCINFSSEKVGSHGCMGHEVRVADIVLIELPAISQGESGDLRSSYRQGHDRCAAAQLTAHCPESTGSAQVWKRPESVIG
jgi:methylenetetrahydrofolate dehydrogenase (NAD+)